MPAIIYALCALTSIACMGFWVRFYFLKGGRLLLYGSICFLGLALNNILLFLDLVVFPTQVDLAIPRTAVALAGVLVFLVALVEDAA